MCAGDGAVINHVCKAMVFVSVLVVALLTLWCVRCVLVVGTRRRYCPSELLLLAAALPCGRRSAATTLSSSACHVTSVGPSDG